jgi:hypothetical protein
MNPQAPEVLDPNSLLHCTHRTRTGRRCHYPVFGNSALCARHTPPQADQTETDLTAAFGDQLLTNSQRAGNINRFLGRLAILVVQNRISPRRAAVLAYVSNLLLRSLPEIDRENDTGRFPPKAVVSLDPAPGLSSETDPQPEADQQPDKPEGTVNKVVEIFDLPLGGKD